MFLDDSKPRYITPPAPNHDGPDKTVEVEATPDARVTETAQMLKAEHNQDNIETVQDQDHAAVETTLDDSEETS